jgi:DNA-binding response OmpR family regulator
VTTVLLAEDDAAIAEPLSRALQREGYEVAVADDGIIALEHVRAGGVDLLVLDLGLPGMDGLEVCRRIRLEVPDLVLMLTARTDEVDFVAADAAPTYVSKPFRLAELLARVRALLRRLTPETVEVGGVRMELSGAACSSTAPRSAWRTRFEPPVLLRAGQVVTREEILREVWNDPDLKTSRRSTCTCPGCAADQRRAPDRDRASASAQPRRAPRPTDPAVHAPGRHDHGAGARRAAAVTTWRLVEDITRADLTRSWNAWRPGSRPRVDIPDSERARRAVERRLVVQQPGLPERLIGVTSARTR